jgi:hypothetical protein
MRKAIRLTLPAVAAVMAFALTGCGDDDEGGGAFGGGFGGGGENTEVPEELEGLEDIEIPGAEDSGGDIAVPSEEENADTSTGGGGGGAPTVADLEGTWFTGDGLGATDSTLSVTSGDVMFMENAGEEGDICYGTATDGAITLSECSVYGTVEWAAMDASLTYDGTTLVVNWSDGTVQEYSSSTY